MAIKVAALKCVASARPERNKMKLESPWLDPHWQLVDCLTKPVVNDMPIRTHNGMAKMPIHPQRVQPKGSGVASSQGLKFSAANHFPFLPPSHVDASSLDTQTHLHLPTAY